MRFRAQRATATLEDHVVILRADIDIPGNLSPGLLLDWTAPTRARSGTDIRLASIESKIEAF